MNELVSNIIEGNQVEYELFWKIDGNLGVCSQWYTGNGFTDDINHYISAEHFMMVGKANLFNTKGNNSKLISKMLSTKYPSTVKSYGRQVKGFSAEVWDSYKYGIVVYGNYLKFSQDKKLGDMLMSTGDAILVEASPYDQIWGIGLEDGHPNCRTPTQWNGLNLLGFALMDVRQSLMRAYQ